MSNIVDKVKDSFRSRSRRRTSEPVQSYADEPLPTSRVAEKFIPGNDSAMPSNSPRDALPAVAGNDQPLPDSAHRVGPLLEVVPDRGSSWKNNSRPATGSSDQSKKHRHTMSQGTTTSTTSMAAGVPDRRSSRRPVSGSGKSQDITAGGYEHNRDGFPRTSQDKPRGRVTGHRTSRSIDVAPHDPSPLVPRYDAGPASINRKPVPPAAGSTTTKLSEHLRLPADFRLGSSERTYVDTTWRPAITSETIIHDRTEVIREAITRDIHVHHYYTYVQPVKVVEVLPARHFRIDERTGAKIEIPAPPGWVMPEHLQPRSPDTAAIKGSQRHYLVNERHPNGILEDPQDPPQRIAPHPSQSYPT